jgi:hypothetical protein
MAKFFFKNGRLVFEIIIYQCNIEINYAIAAEKASAQIIVITASLGGALGFVTSWYAVGAIFVSPPLLISFLFLRNATQQISDQKDYSKFKEMVDKLLIYDDIKKTIQAFFNENQLPITSFDRITMEHFGNSVIKNNLETKII